MPSKVRRIKVGPYDYEVVYDSDLMREVGANGQIAADQTRIYLTEKCSPTAEREVLLHECVHAIWHLVALDVEYPDADSDSVGEKIVARVAPALLALLRDNPRLVEFITGR